MGSSRVISVVSGENPFRRLDKELARLVPEDAALSRTRLARLIRDGAVHLSGQVVTDPGERPHPGATYQITLPDPEPMTLTPEAIPLQIVYEDADLIVVDKPAGMVVHPAPGAWTGTLVAGLLHHCGDDLRGIGDVKRPGIVHRIDKDTSGLLVVAKSQSAHSGLVSQFARHDVRREYIAFAWGQPDLSDPRLMGLPGVRANGARLTISAAIARHASDRKRMAVVANGGRHAVTHFEVLTRFGDLACELRCRLETGRTHQIRVHMAHIGHPLIGDQVYGKSRRPADAPPLAQTFPRQALHARSLGFSHPVTGQNLDFESDLPQDLATLRAAFTHC